jgi:hypothetical protein
MILCGFRGEFYLEEDFQTAFIDLMDLDIKRGIGIHLTQ